MKKIIVLTILTVLSSVSFAQDSQQSSSNGSGNSTLDGAMDKAKNASGDFNSRVSNPFIFCSGPKPGKGNPLRPVYEQICGSGNSKGAAAPVPVPTGNPPTDTKAVQEQFNKLNGSN